MFTISFHCGMPKPSDVEQRQSNLVFTFEVPLPNTLHVPNVDVGYQVAPSDVVL